MNSFQIAQAKDFPVLHAARTRHLSYRGGPMEFRTKPYAVEMFAQLHRFEELAVQKAVQTGQTEMCLCYLFLAAGEWGRTCVYALPTAVVLQNFVSDRIDRHLTGNRHYTGILNTPATRTRRGQARQQSELDNLRIKHFGQGTLMFRAGMVSADWVEYSTDLMILDEMEKFPPDVLQLAKDRLLASPTPQYFLLSNPVLPKSGICREYLQGDQRRYLFRCPHCGKREELDFFRHVVRETDEGWKARDMERATSKEDIRPVCDGCARPFSREEGFGPQAGGKRGGVWVQSYPGRRRASYRLSRLFALDHSLRRTLEEWSMACTSEEAKSRFIRSILGLGYEPADMSMTEAILFRAAVAPRRLLPGEPPPPGYRFCGMDVGSLHHMDFRVLEREAPQEIESTEEEGARTWETRTFHLHAARSFEDALARLKAFRVHAVVVDANPEAEGARKFQQACRAAGITCWLCSFVLNEEGTQFGLKVKPEDGKISIDRTRAFDHALEQIQSMRHAYPVDVAGVSEFLAQMQEPKRVFKLAAPSSLNATDRFVWTKEGPDHYRLAGIYAEAALALQQQAGDFLEVSLEGAASSKEKREARREQERRAASPSEEEDFSSEAEEALYSDTFFEV